MVNPTGYTALDLVGFTDKGPYAPNVNYVRNDLSHDSGNIWRCLIDDTIGIRPTEGANWTIFISEPSNMVETSIAPIETSPATAAHTVGTQLYYNDTLYKVKAAIAVGDSLVVDTNIELADNITTQLAAKANTSDLGTAAAKDSTSTIAQGSTDLIESGAVYSALGDKANTADLGTAAAKDSTNAVTQSSTDLVESGAVYSELGSVKQALSDEVETRAILGAHNLLALSIANVKTLNTHGSWVGNVFTHDGVAYTVDVTDSGYVKSITASGTAGTYSYMYLSRSAIPLYFNKGNYIFTGCPSGGSSTTYFVSDNFYYNGAYVDGDKDTGNGDSASVVNDGSNFTGSIAIYAAAGNVNLVFKPMIRLASDTDPTHQPYAMTNQQLTESLNNNFVLVRRNEHVDVQTDGTETNETFFKRLKAAALSLINAELGTNETFAITGFTYGSRDFRLSPRTSLGTFSDDFYYSMKIEASLFDIRGIQPYSGTYLMFMFYNNQSSITDVKSTTASGTCSVYYDVYKKIQ